LENLARPSLSLSLLLGCGVTYFVVFNYYLFGLLDHFFWAFFWIWASEHIAQMGFLCVWMGLEESFFFFATSVHCHSRTVSHSRSSSPTALNQFLLVSHLRKTWKRRWSKFWILLWMPVSGCARLPSKRRDCSFSLVLSRWGRGWICC